MTKITNMHQTQTCFVQTSNQQKITVFRRELARLSITSSIICWNLFLCQFCNIYDIEEIICVFQSAKNSYLSIFAICRLRRHLQWANGKITILGLFPWEHAWVLVVHTHFSSCQNTIFSIGNGVKCQKWRFWNDDCFHPDGECDWEIRVESLAARLFHKINLYLLQFHFCS